jgi:2-amino-4-hydroxy-6-hydroxymethyldihydropteridine diphosphokinase
VENTDQPWFLNQVAEIGTEFTPVALLEWVRDLERRHGRQRVTPKGPRTLDVDILLFGDLWSRATELQIPHPGLRDRRFVLVPLAELASGITIPGAKTTVGGALQFLKDPAQVRLYDGGTATC